LISLPDRNLESLLTKAKELEKKYEWLQATEYYRKAVDIEIDRKHILRAVELQKKIAYCYYKSAFQSDTNNEFKKRMKLATKAYQKEIRILKTSKERNKQVKINQTRALVAYTKSWRVKNHDKKKKLLEEWWTLENQVLDAYEKAGDRHSVGVLCNDLLEFSHYTLFWYSNYEEEMKLEKKAMRLAEKAISSLSKTNDLFELARAYCFASQWFSGYMHEAPEFRDSRPQILQKGYDYSKKALELALQTDDQWLIGHTFVSAWTAVVFHNFDHSTGIEYGEKIQKYGNITKDKLLLSYGLRNTSYSLNVLAEFTEDPDKQKEDFENARSLAHECVRISKIINHIPNVYFGYSIEISSVNWIGRIETDSAKKKTILQKAIKRTQEGFEDTRDLKRVSAELNGSLSGSLSLLSGTISDIEEKKALLLEAQLSQKKNIIHIEKFIPHLYTQHSISHHNLGLVQIELAKIETGKLKKVEFLEKAVNSIKKSNKFMKKELQFHSETTIINQVIGKHADLLGRTQQQIYFLTGNKKNFTNAIEAFQEAAKAFMLGEMPSHSAEAYWLMAQLKGHRDEHQEASKNYEAASKAYELASQRIPQLKEFYIEYSLYMQAWSQIEQARYSHSIEDYQEAKQHYEKAADLHKLTSLWSYLASNYLAWTNLEEAESLSRKENILQAKQTFQKALQQFSLAEESMRPKVEELSVEEKEMAQKLLETSKLRRKYCEARILLEEAKLLDRKGKYLQSSKNYKQASSKIETIIEETNNEAEHNELKLLAILCQAWEKMANAEEAISSESYIEAAGLFEQAKELCYTKKASLWTLANSNFCKGLAAGIRYQENLDLKENAMAKQYIKNSASNYLQSGFKNASEYAKATQRLFDAYTFMNQAENEVDPEKKTKQYQMAENLLQMAAGSFTKAKQPEKTDQVQQILGTVREEKALAVSLTEVMHAPSVTSSTFSFAAPNPTSESSVGLEKFEHANVQANLVTALKQVKVGESFCLSVEFVNAGREPALLLRVEDFVHPNFVIVKKPEIYRIEESCLNMKGKQLAPLKLVEVKLTLQASRKGLYQLNPKAHYLDELGKSKSLQLKSLEIKVEEVLLEDRVSTGTPELDSLLLGGIPNEYAVLLSGSPCDEREMMVKNFLEAGTKQEEVMFYISTEATGLEGLLENPNFFLFLCNPKPKFELPDLPNVYKLQGKADITNLGIALTKAIRNIDQSIVDKRVCVEVLSDVLGKHGTNITKEWISGLITDLGAKGFTMLAVMDPREHPIDQATTVLNLFDGEISITQSDDPLDCKKSILVKKLRNQDYIKNPICLR